MGEERDDRFGKIAQDNGHLSDDQLEECLAEQRRMRERDEEVLLGQIILQKGFLTRAQFLEVLAIQQHVPWICWDCEVLYDTRELDPFGERNCPTCGKALAQAKRQSGNADLS